MRVFLFRCAWKKALNPPKKGLLVRVEAMETSKRRRIKFDFRTQLHSKGSSEGSGTITEVLDESKDNSSRSSCSLFGSDIEVQDTSSDEENKADAEVTEKQAGYVQTSLTLSSAELEIQSIVDVPFIKRTRTPLIDPVISMVTEKTASTPTPPTTQAHVQMCSTSC
ncbi:hypothetical protein Tco_1511045 [Tanacetum coccineum]